MACSFARAVDDGDPVTGRGEQTVHSFHWLFYFQVMLCGGALATRSREIRGLGGAGFAALAGLLVAYVGARFASGSLGAIYFLPHLLLFPILFLALAAARCEAVKQWMDPAKWTGAIVAAIGGASLEIYFIHHMLAESAYVYSLIFPMNVAAFLILSCGLAVLIARLVEALPLGIPRRRADRPPILRATLDPESIVTTSRPSPTYL